MSDDASPPSDPDPPDARLIRRLPVSLVAVGLVGSVIGGLGAPLITPVATETGVSLAAAQWTLTLPLFVAAIVGPIMGRLGTGPHRRTAILVALAVVALGGVLTAAPLPFPVLLLGRGLQGFGFGLIPMLMSVARDHLPPPRGASTIAMLSVTAMVGIGFSYPLVGFLEQFAGLRVAYGAGLVFALAGFVVVWRAIPADPPKPKARIDVPGAVLLGLGILGALLLISDPEVWETAWLGIGLIVVTLLALAGWAAVELRTAAPLVDLRVLGLPSVLRANSAMFIGGVATYLAFSLLTRYLQTPSDAGYGFGLPGLVAASALVPFSVVGFLAGVLLPRLGRRLGDRVAYVAAASAIALGVVLFVIAPGSLAVVIVAMTVLGFGMSGVQAVMPRLLLVDAPVSETASVLSINQVVRSTGFSAGSALAGLLLATATAPGDILPPLEGYLGAALWVLPIVGIAMLAIIVPVPPRRRH